MPLDIKEIRKNIRKCMTITELDNLINCLEFMGYKLCIRRRNIYERCDKHNADFHKFDDGIIKCYLPPAWSCSFKDMKQLSYNIRLVGGKNAKK